MATIDILTIFDANAFEDNTVNWANPDGSHSLKYSSDHYLRMVSFSDNVTNNGHWNVGVTVKEGDTIRWMETPSNQSEGQTDLIIYGLRIPNQTEWNRYFEPLSANTFHSTRFYIDNGFGTDSPQFQYVAGPNNYLTTQVTRAPSRDVTLNYYLKVVKLKLENGVITPKGTYGIDPTITIKA